MCDFLHPRYPGWVIVFYRGCIRAHVNRPVLSKRGLNAQPKRRLIVVEHSAAVR
jgi:hypothetical protein